MFIWSKFAQVAQGDIMLFWQPYTENFRAPVQRHGGSGYTRYDAHTPEMFMYTLHCVFRFSLMSGHFFLCHCVGFVCFQYFHSTSVIFVDSHDFVRCVFLVF